MTEHKENAVSARVTLPERMRSRPIGKAGFRVPWFVVAVGRDGEPDFRPTSMHRVYEAISKQLCWVCGQKLGRFRSFVIGPMCAINQVTAEPAVHKECAHYSVRVCPFMANPRTKRNTHAMPEGVAAGEHAPGVMLQRNPGVAMLWHTQKGDYHWFRPKVGGEGFLFRLDKPPLGFDWYAEGRSATYAEVMASVESGLVTLREVAKRDGAAAEAELEQRIIGARVRYYDVLQIAA